MNRNLVIRSLVLVVLVLAATAFVVDWNILVGPTGRRSTDDATLQGDPIQLASRATGNLIQVPVADYRLVHAGDLLFAVDDADARARLDQAMAEADAARADLAVKQADIALQSARLAADAAGIQAAEADLEQARLERLRQQHLLHTESYLQRDWQDAVAAEQRQRAMVEGARRALAADDAQRRVLQADLLGGQAMVQARRAAAALAAVELGYTRIAAPFDGIVTARLARLGAYVSPGRALITLVPLHRVWVVANFREVQLTRMRPGQPAVVTVDALPGVRLRGHVESIEPDSQARGSILPPDRATGAFTKVIQRIPVKIVFDPRPDLGDRLRPGLSAEVAVDTATAGSP